MDCSQYDDCVHLSIVRPAPVRQHITKHAINCHTFRLAELQKIKCQISPRNAIKLLADAGSAVTHNGQTRDLSYYSGTAHSISRAYDVRNIPASPLVDIFYGPLSNTNSPDHGVSRNRISSNVV